ncbi:MAG: hypothetical protein COB02_03095 [Candidatus Cloacimonadota bacterium]|nr:MAG: hypothetical protein COB02_03095 [Candidatus Cloacimonadota bacterium]
MLISFLINTLIAAGVLSILPIARYQDFGSCFIVSAIAGFFATLLWFVHPIVQFILLPFTMIPIFGPLLIGLPAFFLTAFLVNTVALYAADQMIEEFEIDGLVNTGLASLSISGATALIHIII